MSPMQPLNQIAYHKYWPVSEAPTAWTNRGFHRNFHNKGFATSEPNHTRQSWGPNIAHLKHFIYLNLRYFKIIKYVIKCQKVITYSS